MNHAGGGEFFQFSKPGHRDKLLRTVIECARATPKQINVDAVVWAFVAAADAKLGDIQVLYYVLSLICSRVGICA